MIPDTHTIVDPRAMVVPAFNTVVADGTVSTAARFNRHTVRTDLY